MNEQNLIIIVSLMAIGMALIIGYAIGHRNGKADEKKESELRHNRIASKQLEQVIFGQVAGRN